MELIHRESVWCGVVDITVELIAPSMYWWTAEGPELFDCGVTGDAHQALDRGREAARRATRGIARLITGEFPPVRGR